MLPAISAAIDPTDRSMPPEMITNVMPTAMIPINDVRVSTFIMLSTVAKSRFSSVPATHSTIRPASGPSPCSRCASRNARPAGAVSVGAGRMGDQLLFGQMVEAECRLQLAAAHDDDAMAEADQLDQ